MLHNIKHRQYYLKPPGSPKGGIIYRSTQPKPLPYIIFTLALYPRQSSPKLLDAVPIYNINSDFNSPPYNRLTEFNINKTN